MSGYYAFEAGADAVYLGLQKYSARSRAQNFSSTELLKLKELAVQKNKKIYIALNTVIKDSEIHALIDDVYFLDRIQIDGIIVQDFGLLHILKKYFPDIRIHASTQMAVHTPDGISKAREMGVCRIVLPRECSKEAVKDFAFRFPDIELEVFIHGAVCYSFSGVCLASGMLFGRSGNRGECAQLCRFKFQGTNTREFPFACKDLFLKTRVSELSRYGIKSLKIEGRLKQPNYVYHTVKYYRHILDTSEEKYNPEVLEKLENNVQYVFSRENTEGKLFDAQSESLIVKKYQRHAGKKIGIVSANTESGFTLQTDFPVSEDDVIAVYLDDKEEVPFKIPIRKFIIENLSAKTGSSGNLVTIDSEKIPDTGQAVYKLYSRDLELPGIRHDGFNEFKIIIPCKVSVSNKDSSASIVFSFWIHGKQHVLMYPVSFRGVENKEKFEKRLAEANKKSVKGIRQLVPELSIETIPLIQSKQMLKIFGFIYNYLQQLMEEEVENIHSRIQRDAAFFRGDELSSKLLEFVSARTNLSPRSSKTTFVNTMTQFEDLTYCDGIRFIPLPPVMLKDEILVHVLKMVEDHSEIMFCIGVNNTGHFLFAEKLAARKNICFFADYFLYIANRYTAQYLLSLFPKILFGYFWIEGEKDAYQFLQENAVIPLVTACESFSPPLFVRAGDFYEESMCIEEKKKKDSVTLSSEGQEFDIIVEDHMTYIFARK